MPLLRYNNNDAVIELYTNKAIKKAMSVGSPSPSPHRDHPFVADVGFDKI